MRCHDNLSNCNSLSTISILSPINFSFQKKFKCSDSKTFSTFTWAHQQTWNSRKISKIQYRFTSVETVSRERDEKVPSSRKSANKLKIRLFEFLISKFSSTFTAFHSSSARVLPSALVNVEICVPFNYLFQYLVTYNMFYVSRKLLFFCAGITNFLILSYWQFKIGIFHPFSSFFIARISCEPSHFLSFFSHWDWSFRMEDGTEMGRNEARKRETMQFLLLF